MQLPLGPPHPRALSSGSKSLALLLQLRSGNASVRIRPGPGAAGGRDGTGGRGWGEQVVAWASSMESRTVPAAGSGSPHRPLLTLGTALGFIPHEWGPTPLHQHRRPPWSWLFSRCTAAMLGVGRSQAWSGLSPLFSAQLRARGPPACVFPPAQGGSGPSLPPAPKAAPWGRGGQCPPPPWRGPPAAGGCTGPGP